MSIYSVTSIVHLTANIPRTALRFRCAGDTPATLRRLRVTDLSEWIPTTQPALQCRVTIGGTGGQASPQTPFPHLGAAASAGGADIDFLAEPTGAATVEILGVPGGAAMARDWDKNAHSPGEFRPRRHAALADVSPQRRRHRHVRRRLTPPRTTPPRPAKESRGRVHHHRKHIMPRQKTPAAAVTTLRSPRIAVEDARARLSRALLRAETEARALQLLAKRFDADDATDARGMAQSIECRLRGALMDLGKIGNTEALPGTIVVRKPRFPRETIRRIVVRGTAA